MPVKEVKGDILDSQCQVIAIPTNCAGAMGNGLAKLVRDRHPNVYRIYMYLFNKRMLRVTRPDLIRDGEQLWLFFPTKDDWRDPSEYHWVDNNLQWIVTEHGKPEGSELRGITSIAMPALGCGLGGLNWDDVRSMIHGYFADHPLEIELYVPYVKHLQGRFE